MIEANKALQQTADPSAELTVPVLRWNTLIFRPSWISSFDKNALKSLLSDKIVTSSRFLQGQLLVVID